MKEVQKEFELVPFRLHPRVFAALGAGLVTNDVVAVVELVKNSYDAFSKSVWLRFCTDEDGVEAMEIEDDGGGMTRHIIDDAWTVVATPFKEQNPFVKEGKKRRRVAGEKGLGRLSAARLGRRLHMLTQAPDNPCWEAEIDWDLLAKGDEISQSVIRLRKYPSPSPFKISGTLLRIVGLKNQWDEIRITDLKDNLARFISPFSVITDFKVYLTPPGGDSEEIAIQSQPFLSKPTYVLTGQFENAGMLSCKYSFRSLNSGKRRERQIKFSWTQIVESIEERQTQHLDTDQASCGPFEFEIRAWDLDTDSTHQIADRYGIRRGEVRKAIRTHKGISVYRDDVLVLPKSENARDWLGLDLRRISRVGGRLSTSQIIGYVAITAEKNPEIRDTTDREQLAVSKEVAEFEGILKFAVGIMETQRSEDRSSEGKEKPLEDLFAALNADNLVGDVETLAAEGADISDALPAVRAFQEKLHAVKIAIQDRFVFYSRLATVGTIALILVHEIRNRTGQIGILIELARREFDVPAEELNKKLSWAEDAVRSLERLADTFAPLASRSYRRRRLDTELETTIENCLAYHAGEIKQKGIQCTVPKSKTRLAVDPGELEPILLNLITNSLYWLGQVPPDNRRLEFVTEKMEVPDRIRIWVHDTGPGIQPEEAEKIFWPGVTSRPGGIGMGLTVASELVASYEGHMFTATPGILGGASFAFDLPVKGGKQ